MQAYSIGEVAKQTGVGVETIRFYERKGLIDEPPRKASGYRQYDGEIIKRLSFIRKAKTLGFTLTEIKELLSLKAEEGSDCEDVKQLAGEKLADIELKLESLKRMKRVLKKLVDQCPGQGSARDCPILDMLSNEDIKND